MNVSRFDPHPPSLDLSAASASPRNLLADRAVDSNRAENDARLDASVSAVARELAMYQAAFRVNEGAMQVLGSIE